MAYLKSIEERCYRCGARASVQLYNWRNAPGLVYCKKCGERALATEKAREKAEAS